VSNAVRINCGDSKNLQRTTLLPSRSAFDCCVFSSGVLLRRIPVSAKDSKGGVHEALQSLVRHLVAKMKEGNADHRPDDASVRSQLTVAKRVRRKPRIPDGVAFEPLQVGIGLNLNVSIGLYITATCFIEWRQCTSRVRPPQRG